MRLIIYGTGNEGKIAFDIAQEQNKEVIGFIDDYNENKMFLNLPILGKGKDLKQHLKKNKAKAIIAIGKHDSLESFEGSASNLRERVYKELSDEEIDTLIHPFSSISKLAKIGPGSIIHTGVTIEPDTVVGRGCIINNGSKLCHDISIGDYTHIAPKVTVTGRVSIGKNVWVGTGTTILDGITIGNNCFIGAGSLVLKDIPDNTLAYGSPAKIVRSLEK